MMNRFITDFSELPVKCSIVLYGAGRGGEYIHELLGRLRPDIEVLGFVDGFKSGNRNGIPIWSIEDFGTSPPTHNLIVISSIYWQEIETTVRQRLPGYRYSIIHPDIVSDRWMFSLQEREKYADAINQVSTLLSSPADRELFRMVIESRTEETGNALDLFAYYMKKSTSAPRQYLEHIRYDVIETVIEGGVCDGGDTLEFLRCFPNLTKLYGFEPFPDAFRRSILSSYLEKEKAVTILPHALWHEKKALHLHPASNGASTVTDSSPISANHVDGLPLDDFVLEKKITKVDFIKMDIEGAEKKALHGMTQTLIDHRPQLAICIYHNKMDFIEIPLFLDRVLDHYHLHLGHYSPSFSETVLYAIPRELYAT